MAIHMVIRYITAKLEFFLAMGLWATSEITLEVPSRDQVCLRLRTINRRHLPHIFIPLKTVHTAAHIMDKRTVNLATGSFAALCICKVVKMALKKGVWSEKKIKYGVHVITYKRSSTKMIFIIFHSPINESINILHNFFHFPR